VECVGITLRDLSSKRYWTRDLNYLRKLATPKITHGSFLSKEQYEEDSELENQGCLTSACRGVLDYL
jgi:hypothetical protein